MPTRTSRATNVFLWFIISPGAPFYSERRLRADDGEINRLSHDFLTGHVQSGDSLRFRKDRKA